MTQASQVVKPFDEFRALTDDGVELCRAKWYPASCTVTFEGGKYGACTKIEHVPSGFICILDGTYLIGGSSSFSVYLERPP